jgi:hypothetical protein
MHKEGSGDTNAIETDNNHTKTDTKTDNDTTAAAAAVLQDTTSGTTKAGGCSAVRGTGGLTAPSSTKKGPWNVNDIIWATGKFFFVVHFDLFFSNKLLYVRIDITTTTTYGDHDCAETDNNHTKMDKRQITTPHWQQRQCCKWYLGSVRLFAEKERMVAEKIDEKDRMVVEKDKRIKKDRTIQILQESADVATALRETS